MGGHSPGAGKMTPHELDARIGLEWSTRLLFIQDSAMLEN
jgi:hypothetical protein